MSRSFLPSGDGPLLNWARNFSVKISAGAVSYGLLPADATDFATKFGNFQTAMAAIDSGNKSRSLVAAKNSVRAIMTAQARILAKKVEATPTVTDSQKLDLGLNVRSAASPINPPTVAPMLDIVSVIGRSVKVHLHQPEGAGRGKPAGVAMAFIYSYIGATPPSDPTGFKFEGTSTRATFSVQFPDTLAGGTQVWLSAAWANPRTQTGPACQAVTAYLQVGVTAAA